MDLHCALCDRQPKPYAAAIAVSGLIGSEERVEDAIEVICAYSRTSIPDRDFQCLLVDLNHSVDGCALR